MDTWERWRSKYPDTQVLSERTGHLRNYSRDPYGRYNPIGGYYAQNGTIFLLMHSSSQHHGRRWWWAAGRASIARIS